MLQMHMWSSVLELLTVMFSVPGELYMGGQEHFYMETQGLIAVPVGEAGEMELYVATQHAAYTQV